MSNIPFIRWLASAILFVLMSSGVVDPNNQEAQAETLRILEVAISGLVLIIYSLYEVVHLYRKTHPTNTISTEPSIFQRLIVQIAEKFLEPKKTEVKPQQ